MTIHDIKQTDLTAAEREVLKADAERWQRMGAGGHLEDWLAYYPGLSIRRRLAQKSAWTTNVKGKGYALAFNQYMRDDGFDTADKALMNQMTAVLWLRDKPEHEKILREILGTLTPGQRSRLNAPITARQRVMAVLKAREGGTENQLRTSPLTILKQQVAEQNRTIAHLKEQLASAENDSSLFDLRRDSAEDIVRVLTDHSAISEHKATTIAKGVLAHFKASRKPAG